MTHKAKYGERDVRCIYCGKQLRTQADHQEQCMEAPPRWLDLWPKHKSDERKEQDGVAGSN